MVMRKIKLTYKLRSFFIKKFHLVALLSVFVILISCEEQSSDNSKIKSILLSDTIPPRSYENIKKSGYIRVGVEFNPTSFFIYRGDFMGFEYELIDKFARSHGLKLQLTIRENTNELLDELIKGKIDIVASGVVNTRRMANRVLFTDYYATSRQVLVQRKSSKVIDDHVELIGKKIHVTKDSPYFTRLKNLSDEIGGDIIIDTTINRPTEKLIEFVTNDSIEYTVSNERVAEVNKKYYDNLDISLPISFSQKLSWAVNQKSNDLKEEVNRWLLKEQKHGILRSLSIKYFANRHLYRKRLQSEYMIAGLGNEFKISQYDSLLKHYSEDIGWDWKLLSSMMYEESKFDRTAKSWAGAVGLFQLMPKTAKGFGGKNMYDPNDNIKTAMAYIKDLQRQWDFIEDKDERQKFIIASYNAGSAHVHDARRLAKTYGHNGEVWDGNVEIFMRKLMESKYYLDRVVRYGYCRGSETTNYVNKILKRYNKYKSLTINNVVVDSLGKFNYSDSNSETMGK